MQYIFCPIGNFFINLLDNLAQRFPEDTQRVMMALDKILNPQVKYL